ncbi:MAG TPA: inosine/xanthosine triphosphatase [Candidatus Saccharimonadia bacterium]|nr:inosine/xanthosine triphosphatase [Candidatus Saccharimonadia bacterium]
MLVVIGSTNKTKILAVEQAFSAIPLTKVKGVEVNTGVSEQPMSDEETQNGAENRARAALEKVPKADLAMGLEGGVQKTKRGLMNSVWCCLIDRDENVFFANGERFYIPNLIAEKILAGREMGPLLDELTGEKDIKKGRGFIGVVTKSYITRPEAYGNLAKLVVGLWYGKEWEKELKAK